MVESAQLRHRFYSLIAELFRRESFDVQTDVIGSTGAVADLVVKSQAATAVVEVKLYRSATVSTSVLERAAAQADFVRKSFRADHAILATGSRVAPEVRWSLGTRHPLLVIYDVDKLAFLASKDPDLISSLNEIIREALAFSDFSEPLPNPQDLIAEAAARPTDVHEHTEGTSRETQGAQLCSELHGIPSGRATAKAFEQKILAALKYIFAGDLTAWSPQLTTETGISVYDVVARVSSGHDFWRTIEGHMRSRYVVFEFKNYTKKIKQGQIYTTEKYLYSAAMRSTAIIISRNGADENALAAARGALRENGKLILNLDLNQVCTMLKKRDEGDDHNAVLVDLVDGMFMRLER